MKLPEYAEIEAEDGGIIEVAIPKKFEVCGGCQGKGTHVHRDIDGNGLTREDFDEDPDFAEDYFAGVYDVTCVDCGGLRVQEVIDYDKVKGNKALEEWCDSWEDMCHEEAREKRMRSMGYEW